MAAAAVAWAVACGDGDPEVITGPVTVPNRAPEAVGTIPERTLSVREMAAVDVSPHFRDPAGDALSYTATSSNAGVTTVRRPAIPSSSPRSRGASRRREAVLVTELMTGYEQIGVRESMSAITIQSRADLGYAVDVTPAQPYRLPSADAVRALEAAPRIPYGDDIWRSPTVFVDPDGRIVRVIPGPDDVDPRR